MSRPSKIFAKLARSLCHSGMSSLDSSSMDLNDTEASEKVWLVQCDKLGLLSLDTLIEWRKGVSSYKALHQFLINIQPLIGIWVHQNPERGNVVYVMPGFLSVVGCRIIPQEVGPLGLEHGRILWSPVFEILCDYEGYIAFFLHGREQGVDYVYPGLLKSVDKTCNVLLLEVEPRHQTNGGKLARSKSFAHQVDEEVSRSESGNSKKETVTSFSQLEFDDQKMLLDNVTSQVQLNVPDTTNLPLFPRSRENEVGFQSDVALLYERRLLLLEMYKCHGGGHNGLASCLDIPLNPTELGTSDVKKSLECASGVQASQADDGDWSSSTKGNTLFGFLKNGLKLMLCKSSSSNDECQFQKETAFNCESKHLALHEFLGPDDTIGLSLRATTMILSYYKAWPYMEDTRSALYKLPICYPQTGHDYAGLWGGTFGWPPGKSGKSLFCVLISYDESKAKQTLIATKILEGSVQHPNGSAMFRAKIGQPSKDTFPWDRDEDSNPIDVKQSFVGKGIATGYGFRYPSSKPGSLFVIHNGLLVFVWKESRKVLTLQRLNLPDLLRKGERVPPLAPVPNFAYLERSYVNVYSSTSNSSNA